MTADERTIARGYPPEAHRVLCVDYDGTIFPFGYLSDDPDPLPGAAAALRKLVAHGYRIVVHTSRLSPTWLAASGHTEADMRGRMEDALRRHGIPFDSITADKRPAEAYIDDRAIRLREGEWPAVADWIIWSGAE